MTATTASPTRRHCLTMTPHGSEGVAVLLHGDRWAVYMRAPHAQLPTPRGGLVLARGRETGCGDESAVNYGDDNEAALLAATRSPYLTASDRWLLGIPEADKVAAEARARY